ncbi:MAG TPA: type 4a pilus biogenesis protein PilO [Burkholderiaceae bacterium]|nr:type 4a pilus biogenesis protein PilO [Burkholderiaceae bacterium]HMX10954.1 type 4a pilus biogenesis protein PilO [Burkholderiaceae bacterium]HMY98760.1 type 4a pilus biogenesis protein PilO [Burkholderiaceae bacterium]HNB43437.1 type 4a pilus biogenesis protein PilO [Burkholderiaceae bacterium]HNG80113.1 type 4a pilus biogenesis protein PilO [Burkholderiaceae bacterium]
MATARNVNIDFEALFASVSAQFRDLNTSEPGQWPLLPKLAAWTAVAVLAVVVGWFAILSPTVDDLTVEENKELQLKEQYKNKLAQAINLDELRKQKLQVQEYVTQLERQLPGKAEMDALLSDINQAGLGRGLQFELFRPGQVIVRDYYAELPIALRVTGRYHDMGAFAADVANLSRIVTLHNLSITGAGAQLANNPASSGVLAMEATARTYRYLDQAEIEERRNAAAKAAKKPAGGGQ